MRVPLHAVLVALLGLVCAVPVRAQESREGARIDFTFDKVDLQTFVGIVSQHTGKRFILSEGAEGKISIVAPRIRADQVYPLFLSILDSIHCAIVDTPDADTYRIVKMPARSLPEAPVSVDGVGMQGAGLVTRVIQLQHIRAADLARALQSRMGEGDMGRLAAVEATDHLILTDTMANIRRLETIIAEIDKPGHARVTEVVRLQHADAQSLARELSAAVAGGMTLEAARAEVLRGRLGQAGANASATGREAAIVASPHSNSLLIVGTQSQIDDLKAVIALMDVDSPSGMNAIYLKYLDAVETAQSLNALLEKSGRAGDNTSSRLAIEASATSRAILVDGTPREVDMVRSLVDDLDQSPAQVHIEVLIAEVSMDEGLNFGLSLGGFAAPNAVGDTVMQGTYELRDTSESLLNTIQGGVFPRGISLALAHGTRLDAAGNLVTDFPGVLNLDAVKRDGNVRILANTSLEAENNREATVQIVNNIPLLKSTIQGTGTSRDVIENIDRIDVGIKLAITPHVNPDGEIQMKLAPSIEAIIDPGPQDKDFAPTIARREVSTTITVADGSSAVISGLIREDETEIVRRIPLLGDIPILGWLFRNTVKAREKTNLLIIVTPYIVKDASLAGRLERAFEARTGVHPRRLSTEGAPAETETTE